MGLPKKIQIPCHHVLSNQNVLKFKKGAPAKQFFNINLGIGIIKKTNFLFVFLTYLPVFLLKFQSGELLGCGIKLHIQWVPARHTFDGPCYPKNKKYLKKRDDDWVLIGCEIKFRIQRALPLGIWVKTQEDMSKIRTKKVVFSILPPKLITIILLFSYGGPF